MGIKPLDDGGKQIVSRLIRMNTSSDVLVLHVGDKRESNAKHGTVLDWTGLDWTYQITILQPQKLVGAHVLVRALVVGHDTFAVGGCLLVGAGFESVGRISSW